MPKPTNTILAAAGAIALAAVLGAYFLRDNHLTQVSAEREPDQVAATRPPEPATTVAPPMAATKPTPPPAPPSPAAPKPRPPETPGAGKHLDEASLMAKLHDLGPDDPALSLKLARDAVARFPDSPSAPEFAWNVAKALFNMGRIQEAEEEARVMVKKYPGNYFAGDVEHHLLNHPPNPSPNPPSATNPP